ncbi:MCE family protein [Longimycelium tulufanense]|uniref:MCE family protein n=1 Tax=Longimycelium tulufanense TaxID=907463 RepID=UPI003570B065
MRRLRALGVAVLTAGLVAGCGGEFGGLYGMPLPGGADLGDRPYRVTVHFTDVLDLVPQAAIKVNDVSVGKVERIELVTDNWHAEVTVAVPGDVELPANAEARLRQSSLLGEKFVELAPPKREQPTGRLADGDVVPLQRTNRNPEVEEVLGALSLVLNGGGIAQLQTITRELNAALSGNEPQLRELLDNLNKLVSTLDGHKGEITRALDGLNRLSATLDRQRDRISGVVKDLGPGLEVLADQREQLVTMLRSLDSLSGVATDVVNRGRDDLLANLRALRPTLTKLTEAGQNLPRSFQLLLTFPFPDAAVEGIRGDYTNLYATLDLDLTRIIDNLSASRQAPVDPLGPGEQGTARPGERAPGAGELPLPLQPPRLPLPGRSGSGDLLDDLLGGGR